MEIIRTYYNSLDEILQQHRISISVSPPNTYVPSQFASGDDLKMILGPQIVRVEPVVSSASLAGASAGGSREISNIEISGDFDTYDTTGPDYNLEWATKTLASGQEVTFDMSNLPKIGETI